MTDSEATTFGPVPSRRLGHSLGINNIPPKICTYSCIYCQLGRTIKVQVDRHGFYDPDAVVKNVEDKIAKIKKAGEKIDYLTFVPDGEPTLDINLGQEIASLKPLGLPIAVITNGSLIWQQEVKDGLMGADWVSLKVDAVDEPTWRRINRPHKKLKLSSILEGVLEFARSFQGKLMTETMLVSDVNDTEQHLSGVVNFLAQLQPTAAYLATPTRPPAEKWVNSPDEDVINRAYQILNNKLEHVEYLIGYEGNTFAFTGNAKEDLLNITAVHPMREDAVDAFLIRANANWDVVSQLINHDQLIETTYGGYRFYLRRFRKHYRKEH